MPPWFNAYTMRAHTRTVPEELPECKMLKIYSSNGSKN